MPDIGEGNKKKKKHHVILAPEQACQRQSDFIIKEYSSWNCTLKIQSDCERQNCVIWSIWWI